MPWLALVTAAVSAGSQYANSQKQAKAQKEASANASGMYADAQDYARNGPLGSTYAPGGAAAFNYVQQLLGVPGSRDGYSNVSSGGPQSGLIDDYKGVKTGTAHSLSISNNIGRAIGSPNTDPVKGYQDRGIIGALDPGALFSKGSHIKAMDVEVDPTKDWAAFWAQSPDLQKEWGSNKKLQALFGGDPNKYAAYAYKNGLGDRALVDVGAPGSSSFHGPAAGDQGGQTSAYQNFLDSAGYKTQLQSGVDAINSSAAARGLLDSGATGKSLARFGQGLGAQYFNNYISQLMGTANTGLQGATAAAGQNSQLTGANATQQLNQMNGAAATTAQGNQNAVDSVIYGANSIWGAPSVSKTPAVKPGTNNPSPSNNTNAVDQFGSPL